MRSERLLHSEDYRTTIAKRCRSDDQLFTVYAAKRPTGGARLGITVSRRVSTKAVRRNRLKRRLRHACRELELPAEDSLVVLAQARAAHSSFQRLREELAQLVASLQAEERVL